MLFFSFFNLLLMQCWLRCIHKHDVLNVVVVAVVVDAWRLQQFLDGGKCPFKEVSSKFSFGSGGSFRFPFGILLFLHCSIGQPFKKKYLFSVT